MSAEQTITVMTRRSPPALERLRALVSPARIKHSKQALVATARTIAGTEEHTNEDAYAALPEHGLFAVSDGVGGHRAGEVASRIVIHTLCQRVRQCAAISDECWLHETIQLANSNVRKAAAANPRCDNMGATLVAAWIREGRLTCFHVGDSRAYRLRAVALECLTKDHARAFGARSNRRMLTRALGLGDTVTVEVTHQDWHYNDALLLTSDGISDPLNSHDISRVLLEHNDPQARLDALLCAATTAGGKDDKTAVWVQ